jgi:HAMP domain-containing protein
MNLIQSRTALRAEVAAFPSRPEEARQRIARIIEDAEASVDVITRISVYDIDHQPISAAGTTDRGAISLGARATGDFGIVQYLKRPDGGIDAVLHAALRYRGKIVGFIATVVDTRDLIAIVENRDGLGDSGEMLLVAEFSPGTATLFNPLRHRPDDWLSTFPVSTASEPMRAALGQRKQRLMDVPDYRGVLVWAAVRPLPNFPGGILVKIDAEEELARVTELRNQLIDVALAAGALSILGGAALGIFLARPIRRLNEVVERIRQGDQDARADESCEDEVSFLAESFNELMDEIRERGRR